MSDYYGSATLEDWLAEEVLHVPGRKLEIRAHPNVIHLFERWRINVEANIELWMDSDDGYGNNLSWRGWGRGFYAIPDEDEEEFEHAVEQAQKLVQLHLEQYNMRR